MSRTYLVKPGDTLSNIAYHLDLPWRALASANGIADPGHLRVGTLLHVPVHTHHTHHHGPHHRQVSKPLPPPADLPASISETRPASGGARLGDLSMRYETGFRPGQETQAAAVVSSGVGDAGGISYGAYQLASSAKGGHQVQTFLRRDGLGWASQFNGLDPTSAGDFGTKWKDVAASQAQAFFEAQHAYIESSHYAPVVNYVKTATGLDINQRSRSVQNVVWSMSVQHGKAKTLVATAINEVGAQGTRSNAEYDRDLINKLYDDRSDYVDALGLTNLKARYTLERHDALQQLGTN